MAHVYLRPRDKNGSLAIAPKQSRSVRQSPKETFYGHYRRFGVADWRIDQMYAEHQREEAASELSDVVEIEVMGKKVKARKAGGR